VAKLGGFSVDYSQKILLLSFEQTKCILHIVAFGAINETMKLIISILIGISLQINLFGQDNIVFVWDKDASSISNAKNLLSVHRIIYEFKNKNIKLKYWE
jgi:hypothetical protein